jgi:hypothetical protein
MVSFLSFIFILLVVCFLSAYTPTKVVFILLQNEKKYSTSAYDGGERVFFNIIVDSICNYFLSNIFIQNCIFIIGFLFQVIVESILCLIFLRKSLFFSSLYFVNKNIRFA